jgi:hypothetical protein
MPDDKGEIIAFHQDRGKGSGPPGLFFLLLAFILFGWAFFSIMKATVLPPKKTKTYEKQKSPRVKIFPMMGSMFFLAVWGSMVLTSRAQNNFKHVEGEKPWKQDYPWDPKRANDDLVEKGRQRIKRGLWLLLLMVPVNWWLLFSPTTETWIVNSAVHTWMIVISMLPNLTVLAVWGNGILIVKRSAKFGKSWLEFESFPYFLGEEFRACFRVSNAIQTFDRLTVTLRCIKETYRVFTRSASSSGTSKSDETRMLFQDKIETHDLSSIKEYGKALPIHFKLPSEEYGTNLHPHYPQYWELVIHADMPGLDYVSTFLVPIYEKPGNSESE